MPGGQKDSDEPTPIHLESWATILETVKEDLTRLGGLNLKLDAQLDELHSRIAVARARAKRLLSYDTKSSKTVAIEVTGTAGQPMDLEVSYRIHGPQWFPRYSIRADLKEAKMDIIMDALVKQSTGEDWDDATIEFSAAEPSQSADLPRLLAWRIGAEGTGSSSTRYAGSAQPTNTVLGHP
ncbi:MAG: DUF4139 domain-containing protein, partial [Planctomycetota bacterium]|nr:DUF4139 domain-containing protein [Planctomycetota bacterium]